MVRFLVLLFILSLLSSCTLGKIFLYNEPEVSDHHIFPTAVVHAPEEPFRFAERPYSPLPPIELFLSDKYCDKHTSFEEFLIKHETTSFMVIRNDTILYENYFNGGNRNSPAIVFSVTKALTTTLVSMAIDEGYIESLEVPAWHYIPEWENDARKNIQLKHLTNMTSGLDFKDKRDILKLARAYYSSDVNSYVTKTKLKYAPGEVFAYKSVDTQLLGICLEKATGITAFQYLEDKLWQPLGMEYDAHYTLDSQGGSSRMYGGLAACTRDLAKVGRLYLNKGYYNGEQLLPQSWINSTKTRVENEDKWWGYANGFWLDGYRYENLNEAEDFYAAGFKGQVVYMNPQKQLIIIRLGVKESKIEWNQLCSRLAAVIDNPLHSKEETINKSEISGLYKSDKGTIVRLESDGANWLLTKKGSKSIRFISEGPQSFFNEKKRKRIILEKENGKIVGFHLDNMRSTRYFEKIEELETFELISE
ncbi:beta-lactamase family protein [Chitinophagales bacterium]|nr:beta-lactamase family protein [Chitinophagales bacterium]